MSLTAFIKVKHSNNFSDFIDLCYALSPDVLMMNNNELFMDLGKLSIEKAFHSINTLKLLSYKATLGLAFNKVTAYMAALVSTTHPQLVRSKTGWGYVSWVKEKDSLSFIQSVNLKTLAFLLPPKTLEILLRLGLKNLGEVINLSMDTLKDFLGDESAKITYLLSRGIFPHTLSPLPLKFSVFKSIPPNHILSDLGTYLRIACQELSVSLSAKSFGCRKFLFKANTTTGTALVEEKNFLQPKTEWDVFENICVSFLKTNLHDYHQIQLVDFLLQVKEYEKMDCKQVNIYDLQPPKGQSIDHIKILPFICPLPTVTRREQLLAFYDSYRQGRNKQ